MPAHANDRIVIETGVPAGFADITAERKLLVDLYYGGLRRGEALVIVTPGAVRFAQPEEVLALLPALQKHETVLDALSGQSLPANSELKCASGADPRSCGRMTPAIVSVIYDPDRFRLDIFLNPELVGVQAVTERQYLPEPQSGLSLINSVGAVLSGEAGNGSSYFSAFDQLVVADGDRRLRADVGYASGYGFEADRIAFEADQPGRRYSAGLLWSPGTEIEGRRKLLGVGIESQIDTRLDKDTLTGIPVVVYLDQRARVDILREGRLIGSAIYEAGSQQIDTASLPEGSYNITLRIEEPGRPAREERRFFSQSRRIPSPGRADFFAFGGVLTVQRGAPRGPIMAYLQGGGALRAGRNWALGGSLELVGESVSAELSATVLSPLAQLRAAAVAGTDGAHGGILQLTSAGTSRFNFNLDLRLISQDRSTAHWEHDTFSSPVTPFDLAPYRRPQGDFAQLGGLVSYTLPSVRFLGSGFYRRDEGQEAQYSFGPSLEWDVLRHGQLTLTMRGDMATTERGSAGFAGISLRLFGPRTSFSALAGWRASGIEDNDQGEGSVAAVAGSWTSEVSGGELALGAGVERRPMRKNAVLTGDYRHPVGSLAADFAHTDGSRGSSTQYSIGVQTTAAMREGNVHVAGKTASDSLLVARVSGAAAHDSFEVLVNEQPAGSLSGDGALTLALPSYRNYAVRIRPTGDRLFAYDSATRSIALYPGSVATVDWDAAPITIKVGRLVAADGEPIRGATLTARGVWSETDEEGRFRIEAPDEVELNISRADGTVVVVTLPAGVPDGGVYRVGSLVCYTRDTELGIAIPSRLEPGVR